MCQRAINVQCFLGGRHGFLVTPQAAQAITAIP